MSSTNSVAVAAAVIAVIAAIYAGRHHGSTEPTHGSIAFIDMATVMQQSEAGKSVQEQLGPRQQALRKEAEAKLNELKQEQDTLNKQHGTMTDQKFAEGAASIQKKINDWNAEAQKREAALNTAAAPALQKIQETLRTQLAAIAAEDNFTAILPLQDSFYAEKSLDVTSEAIRRLDAKLPQVEISFKDAP